MNDIFLRAQLEPVVRRHRRLGLVRHLTIWWAALAAVALALGWLRHHLGWQWTHAPVALPALAALGALALAVRAYRRPVDLRATARLIEQRYPDLDALLLTAVEHLPRAGQPPSYLEQRVIEEAREHALFHPWTSALKPARAALVHGAHLAALALLVTVLWNLRVPSVPHGPEVAAGAGVFVSPGDTTLEKGQSLVVLARFSGPLPGNVTLALAGLPGPTNRVPLVKSLADPVFGGTVMDVPGSFTYRIEYAGQQTREFKVDVFELPRLERADAELAYPAYTGLPRKRVEDTRRITAVEGTRLDLALQLNKPVASATLVPKDGAPLSLHVETHRAAAALTQFPLAATQSYELRLVDADGRTNRTPARFVVEVQPNREPQLKLLAPRGDLRPSPLEEIRFEGEVWDDFGLLAYGLAYARPGDALQEVTLGQSLPGGRKQTFRHLLALENLGAEPDQLFSYYLWAEDLGPDGQRRRKTGDLFFAEVRPFDEIFRQGQAQDGESAQESPEQSESGQGNQTTRLVELQKQIVSATWKLQQQHGPNATPQYLKDAPVVRDAQAEALDQAGTAQERAREPRQQTLWQTVTRSMTDALEHLKAAATATAPLTQALAAEQAAYQALLQLQAREHEVARSRNRSRSQSQNQAQQRNQQQLNELELTESESRYETQRQAAPQLSEERRESLQVLNRLQELARRQQDLNERVRELQTALQEARTDTERDEVRRRLKRLREEEQQMLADLDELRQRMERGENQARLANERQRLDQVRDQVQRASEALDQASVPQALASGTRAQQELQDLRDDLRRQNARAFSEDMRQMRAETRELARQQETAAQELQRLQQTERRSLSDSGQRQSLQDRLATQQQRLTNVLEQATRVSQQAEAAEPLLSRQLYDTVRKLNQDETRNTRDLQADLIRQGLLQRSLYEQLNRNADQPVGNSLRVTSELLRQGHLPQATRAEERARAGIHDLRTSIERAAESVLGDETEALRLAQKELEQLTEQLDREAAAAEAATNTTALAATARSARDRAARAQAGEPQPGQDQARGQSPSQPQASARNPAQSQDQGQGQGQGQDQAQPQADAQAESEAQAQAQAASPGSGERASPPRGQRAAQTGAPGRRSPGESPNADPGALADASRRNAMNTLDRLSPGGRGGTDDGNRSSDGTLERLDSGGRGTGPITGTDFAPWSDRLREVEELLDEPALRNDVAAARERARLMRLEFKRDLKKPDWAVVRLEVVKPLVEVRSRIQEDLARRESRTALVPIDRDPVPGRFTELVRRYYEELGKDAAR